MRKWRSSAAYRIAFANFAAFALGLALLGLVVFWVMHVEFTRELDSTLSDEAQELAEEYYRVNNAELLTEIADRESSRSPTKLLYAVFAPDGRRVAGTLETPRPQLGFHNLTFVDPEEGPDSARGFAIDLSANERLLVAADLEWVERVDETVLSVIAVAFLSACLVAFGGAIFLGAYVRKRLESITTTAETIISGDFRGRMPVSARRDEFDQVALTLNRMLNRIEGLLENLRQVSNDIAHDLRTPLARLRNSLERGLSAERRGKEAAAVVEDAIRRVDEVLSLFAAMLRIAEVESGETRRLFKPVDVSQLATELAESYADAIKDANRTLFWSIEPGLVILGDHELLSQAAINLLENAQQHTPTGTVIRLTAVAAGDLVFLQIADNGPGVPEADFGRITKRFAQLDRSRSTGGYGLGLSLVSAIAKLHGGKLVVKSAEPGLSTTIELPVINHYASEVTPA